MICIAIGEIIEKSKFQSWTQFQDTKRQKQQMKSCVPEGCKYLLLRRLHL